MTIEFKLATQAEGTDYMTLLEDLTVPVTTCVPIATFQAAQDEEQLGDGSIMPVGSPSADWLFPMLTPTEYGSLKDYAGWVYVRTINDEGTYGDYLGYLSFPISPPRIKAGFMFDLTLHFGMLVYFVVLDEPQ